MIVLNRLIDIFRVLTIKEILYRVFYNKVIRDFTNKFMLNYTKLPKLQLAKLQNLEVVKMFPVSANLGTYVLFEEEYTLNSLMDAIKKTPSTQDVRYTWEVNRLQILPQMAIESLHYDSCITKEDYIRLLDCWWENNEYSLDMNWSNGLEVAVRLMSILMSINILMDNEILNKYEDLIKTHIIYLYNSIPFSSAVVPNNHVLGEIAALYYAMLFLETDNKFSKKVYRRINLHLSKHINLLKNNGEPAENSLGYHFFTYQIAHVLYLSDFIHGDKKYMEVLNKHINKTNEFLNLAVPNGGKMPIIGDDDNAFFYRFSTKMKREEVIINQHLNILTFYNINFIKECPNTGIYNGEEYFIYNQNNMYLFVKAARATNHAHCDNLAPILLYGSDEILIDPGTYIYNLPFKKRLEFFGGKYHSTISNIKNDQAKLVTTFRLFSKAKYNMSTYISDEETRITLEYIDNDIIVTRNINICAKTCLLEISDLVKTKQKFVRSFILNTNFDFRKYEIINKNMETQEIEDYFSQIINISSHYGKLKQARRIYKQYKSGEHVINTVIVRKLDGGMKYD